jgi:hypothetical protein
MLRNSKIWLLVAFLISVLFSAGCGGGGGGGALSALSGLFVTDSFRDDYDHVWVTITKVTFDGAKGPVVAYDNPAGVVVDLKTLRDATGAKYSLLGTLALPADTYSDVQVVLLKDLTLVPKGQTTGVAATFTPLDASGLTTTLTLPLTPKAITSDFCVDFDLASWTISGSQVTAVIKESNKAGLEQSDRQVEDEYHGAVSNLSGTAPTQTFTLASDESAFSVTVTTDANTAILNSDGSANPALANGQHVALEGTFDATTHTLAATKIIIKVGDGHGIEGPGASGVPSAGDPVAGTFTLTFGHAEGFLPTGTSITVATDANTLFFKGSGLAVSQTDFFTALATSTGVIVHGTFDATSQTLTAKVAILRSASPDGSEVEGAASNPDSVGLKFDLTVNEFEGLPVTKGSIVHVTLDQTTTLVAADRTTLTTDAFFTALATATGVTAEGTYDPNTQTLTAKRIKLQNQAQGEVVKVRGPANAIDATAHTLTLAAGQWEDAPLTFGEAVAVTTDANTVYLDITGQTITQDAWFTAAATAKQIEVTGPITLTPSVSIVAKTLKIGE